jgi:hypothetical protein
MSGRSKRIVPRYERIGGTLGRGRSTAFGASGDTLSDPEGRRSTVAALTPIST